MPRAFPYVALRPIAPFSLLTIVRARETFERALSIDLNFSESHGGIAVLDALEGKTEKAWRESMIALRLDKKSLGGALATILLLDQSGRPMPCRRSEKSRSTRRWGSAARPWHRRSSRSEEEARYKR